MSIGVLAQTRFLIHYLSAIDRAAVSSPLPKNGESDLTVKSLEARQDEIMKKLYELKAAVEGLAKTVTTPDADMDLTVSSSLSSQSCSSTAFKGITDLDTVLGKVRNQVPASTCFFGFLEVVLANV